MDRYADFAHLKNGEHQDTDFRILRRTGSSGIAVISIHGGEIEQGTTRIADAIAGQEHSFYSFEGRKKNGNWALHITSNRFDEPTAMEIVCQANIILSIHGCKIMEPVVYLGGLDIELKELIRQALENSGFQTLIPSDPCFRATDQKNICNLCGRGMGIQMEISRGLRAQMFLDLTPEGRLHHTEIFTRFIDSVRKAIEPFATGSPETPPLHVAD